jgi:hypothetical protein
MTAIIRVNLSGTMKSGTLQNMDWTLDMDTGHGHWTWTLDMDAAAEESAQVDNQKFIATAKKRKYS